MAGESDGPLRGPHSYYRPKTRQKTVTLTQFGFDRLAALSVEKAASESDVVEQLVRRFGPRVHFKRRRGSI